MRSSKVITKKDAAGEYEIEIFDCAEPKGVIVCSHGKGVRRWDGEKFFYNVAEHYADYAVNLVDQNQPYKDTGCYLNDLKIMVARVQDLIDNAAAEHPGVPIIVVGHSMGCGVVSQLTFDKVTRVIFVTPAAGDEEAKQVNRYGEDVVEGKEVISSDGLIKYLSKEFIASVQGLKWEQEYQKMLDRFSQVYVFEAGDEEIVGEDRFAHRTMPFAGYKIIPGAKHNLAGEPLQHFFAELDTLM